MKPPKLKVMVEAVLKKHPMSRDCDKILTGFVWVEFYSDKLFRAKDGSRAIKLNDMLIVPSEDKLSRVRRKIQNEDKKYLPTKKEVAIRRGISEEAWYNWSKNI